MTDDPYSQGGDQRPQQRSSADQQQAYTSTRSEMHELGNVIVSLQYCLRQLGGRQRTGELEEVVRSGLEVCEQGIAAFRKVHEAVLVRH